VRKSRYQLIEVSVCVFTTNSNCFQNSYHFIRSTDRYIEMEKNLLIIYTSKFLYGFIYSYQPMYVRVCKCVRQRKKIILNDSHNLFLFKIIRWTKIQSWKIYKLFSKFLLCCPSCYFGTYRSFDATYTMGGKTYFLLVGITV